MSDRSFYLQVAEALSGCQLVEQELKLYISEALQLVQECVGNKLPFRISGDDYEDASLERLIDAFKKLSDNTELVTALRKFKDERNFFSHKGIAHCLDYDGELDLEAVNQYALRLASIRPGAERLREAINNEANKFRGYLWFEDVSEK
jgi:hypothetical protein